MIKLVHHEMVINSKFLEVPRSYYQRNLNANRVKRIAAEFDERIANAPKVSYRDGHYYVFDGQHTIAARKLLNNNCDLNIVCKVYSGLTERRPGSHCFPERHKPCRFWPEFRSEPRKVENRLHRYGICRVSETR